MSEASAKELFFVALVQTAAVLWVSVDLLVNRNGFGVILLLVALRDAKITLENWDGWHNPAPPTT